MTREPDFTDDVADRLDDEERSPYCLETHPAEILVATGTLPVPPGTYTHDFSAMEAMFRSKLWPPVIRGRVRWKRKLRWNAARTELRYEIYDMPSPCVTDRH